MRDISAGVTRQAEAYQLVNVVNIPFHSGCKNLQIVALRMTQCCIPEETSEYVSLMLEGNMGRAHIVGEDVSYVEKCDAFLAINEIFDECAFYNLEGKLRDD